VLGDFVLRGRIRISIVDRTPVTTGYDHPLACLFLDVVEELWEDRIDVLLAADDGQPMAATSFTISEGGRVSGVGGVNERWVEGAAATTEKIFGDPRKVCLRFPWIGAPRSVIRIGNGKEILIAIPVNRLAFTIESADLFPFRLLHPRTADKKKECE